MKRLTIIPLLALTALPLYAQDGNQGAQSESQVYDAQQGAQVGPEHNSHASPDTSATGEDWVRDFGQADQDGDGFLSAVEARDALPSHVLVIDTDNDGQLSKLEVQNAVPGLRFEEGGEASVDSRIGEAEYDAIVQAIENGGTEQDA